MRANVAYLAAVTQFDRVGSLPQDSDGIRYLEMEGPEVISVLRRPKALDRDLRRYIARRLYQSYASATLDTPVTLDSFDQELLGVKNVDFLRNAQVLEQEGYLHIDRTESGIFDMIPTAKLVRDVERYGAAQEDAVAERDYLKALDAYPGLAAFIPELALEYRRYSAAVSDTELESVFRAVAPLVEVVAKQLLLAHGSKQLHGSLGTVIAEIHSRSLGGVALLSQLNHVLKFARDLAQHGAPLPLSVLRIACENAFELVPQLGALFPRNA